MAKAKLLERVNYFGQIGTIDTQGRVLDPGDPAQRRRDRRGRGGHREHGPSDRLEWRKDPAADGRDAADRPTTGKSWSCTVCELSCTESVLLNEIVEFLRPARDDGTLVDATVGLGGHAEALLERYPLDPALGIDRDPQALAASAARLEKFGDRVTLAQGRHETLIDILKQQNIECESAACSPTSASRRCSSTTHRADFRSATTRRSTCAWGRSRRRPRISSTRSTSAELATILRDYGEEPMARRIARGDRRRARRRADRDDGAAGGDRPQREAGEAATRSIRPRSRFRRFASPRTRSWSDSTSSSTTRSSVLERGARIAIISFHSLEDRIVKRALRRLEGECTCPPGLPVCGCGAKES